MGRKRGESRERKGPTFVFSSRLPEGMSPEEARERVLEVVAGLALTTSDLQGGDQHGARGASQDRARGVAPRPPMDAESDAADDK